MVIFIIEHLEPKLYKWCTIEYKHISKIVGKENLWITNLKPTKQLNDYARIIKQPVSELDLKNTCVLDPEAQKTLSPDEHFDYYIFGGILGDYPPRKRTKEELTSKITNPNARNIGKEQMSTDNAVYVVKKINEGNKLSELKFQDELEIPLGKNESTVLPYRYILVTGKPLISEELLNYLKKRRGL